MRISVVEFIWMKAWAEVKQKVILEHFMPAEAGIPGRKVFSFWWPNKSETNKISKHTTLVYIRVIFYTNVTENSSFHDFSLILLDGKKRVILLLNV